MSTSPAFAATPLLGAIVLPTTADTSLTSPTHIATVFTAGVSGSKVEEIDVVMTGTSQPGLVNLFLYNGTTFFLFDQATIYTNAVSSTEDSFIFRKTYQYLFLPSSTWTLVATVTVVSNPGVVLAFGGNF